MQANSISVWNYRHSDIQGVWDISIQVHFLLLFVPFFFFFYVTNLTLLKAYMEMHSHLSILSNYHISSVKVGQLPKIKFKYWKISDHPFFRILRNISKQKNEWRQQTKEKICDKWNLLQLKWRSWNFEQETITLQGTEGKVELCGVVSEVSEGLSVKFRKLWSGRTGPT